MTIWFFAAVVLEFFILAREIKTVINVYIDGSSLGNPGKITIGYVIYKDTTVLKKESVSLGTQTNNFAEYMALIFALIDVFHLGEKECSVFSDSKLLCEQINGNYAVKNNNIYPLFVLGRHIISKFTHVKITHINRENNKEADYLSRQNTL